MPKEIWYEYPTLKSGKTSKRLEFVGFYPYTEIDRCETCGRLGAAAWVRKWWYQRIERVAGEPFLVEPTLCMGCFNRMRPAWRADKDAHELAALVRKLQREIKNARKDENCRRPSRLPSGDDGRCS